MSSGVYRSAHLWPEETDWGIVIDFNNASFAKLKPVDNSAFEATIRPMFVDGEQILGTFKGMRDGVVFTNKRIVAINVQGLTGKKQDFTSLPYSKVQAFSVETAGVFDLDSELDLWFSGLGRVRFEFTTRADVSGICRLISQYILGEDQPVTATHAVTPIPQAAAPSAPVAAPQPPVQPAVDGPPPPPRPM